MTIPYQMNCKHSASGWCLACVEEIGVENARLTAEVTELRERLAAAEGDQRRWKFVASHASITGPKMNGQHHWHLGPVRNGRGPTIEDAVDAAIEFYRVNAKGPTDED